MQVRMRRGWGARRERRGRRWARGRVTHGAQGTGWGLTLGAGRRRARGKALAAAAGIARGAGNPRGFRRALGELGACFCEADPGASPGGAGRSSERDACSGPGLLPPEPWHGDEGSAFVACPTSHSPLCWVSQP